MRIIKFAVGVLLLLIAAPLAVLFAQSTGGPVAGALLIFVALVGGSGATLVYVAILSGSARDLRGSFGYISERRRSRW